MRFKWLTGDIDYLTYGGKWVSKKRKDGSAFVLELINWHDATGETDQDKYNVSIGLVSPADLSKEDKQSAFESLGIDGTFDDLDWDHQIEAIHMYGSYATLYQESGNNSRVIMKSAREFVSSMDIEAELNKPANAIGSTRRDFMKGDIMAGVKRLEEEENKKNFIYAEGELKNGSLVLTNKKLVDQSKLTSDCFLIQINGLEACENCEYLNTEKCGGKNIRKKLLAEAV